MPAATMIDRPDPVHERGSGAADAPYGETLDPGYDQRNDRVYTVRRELDRFVPDGIDVKVCAVRRRIGHLFPVERAIVAGSVPARQDEFSSGRWCARQLLRTLGYRDVPIGMGPSREPLWPSQVVGTISHDEGICMAAVGTTDRIAGIGVDVTGTHGLSPHVADLVSVESERMAAAGIFPCNAESAKCVFAAKEALYKAIFPLVRRFVDFAEVRINFTDEGNRWTPVFANAGLDAKLNGRVQGRLGVTGQQIIAVAWVV